MHPIIADITLTWETAASVVAIIASAAQWFYLPKQVEVLEKKVEAQAIEIKVLTANHAASNTALGELSTSVKFILTQLEKIAAKLNVS